ncbi:MAG: zinc-dependent alcohol dehydrogenase family protein [Candidatus Promineifilaceae bacterium]|nr:zinc-dependent alcohol dehydrogenase family protein [Candidatus Promineifilaceae bacterium]
MKALLYTQFGGPIELTELPDPLPENKGVVIQVGASGICRSDWHGWMGHDPDITLPHVPGHELAGTVVAAGPQVQRWKAGDRVTLPFVGGCGTCPQCSSGNHQVCDFQFQPGFTHWGSFAEYVAIDYADINLVRLPETMDDVTAASLGCRFATSFRALVAQGQVSAGQWVAVHGCGGVGLSAVMIASALGANVVAIDINDEQLKLAKSVGAAVLINSAQIGDLVSRVKEISAGGVHVSIDALGSQETCFNSIANLRKRGKHIQVGLMTGDHIHPQIPMEKVISNELEILGSHGMQAHEYGRMLAMITAGKLQPERLIGRTVTLDQAASRLAQMGQYPDNGITIINQFQ